MTTTTGIAWKLTGKPQGGGECEHCGRALRHRYEVTSSQGRKMTVGRGCLKAVTGWTLSAAQAERELRMIEVRARRAANWAAWAAANPRLAEVLDADCEQYRGRCAACHEIRLYVEDGEPERDRLVAGYMARLHGIAA